MYRLPSAEFRSKSTADFMASEQSTIQDDLGIDQMSNASAGGPTQPTQPSQDPDPEIASLRQEIEEEKQRGMSDIKKCHQCQKVPVFGIRKSCDGCLIDRAAKTLRTEQIPSGRLCPKCGERAIMGRNRSCDICRITRKPLTEEQKERRKRNSATRASVRLARGHCRKCDTPAVQGKRFCEKCLERERVSQGNARARGSQVLARRARRLEALEKGLCVLCAKAPPTDGRVRCERCTQTVTEWTRRRKERTRNPLLEDDEDDEDDRDEKDLDNAESNEEDNSGVDNVEGISTDSKGPEGRNSLRNGAKDRSSKLERHCVDCGQPHARKRSQQCTKCAEAAKLAKAKKSAQTRKRHDDALAKGLCVRCKLGPPRAGAITCEPCLARKREQVQRRARAKKDAQLLLSHGIIDLVDKEVQKKLTPAEQYRARRSEGLCGECGQRARDGKASCEMCHQRKMRHVNKPEIKARRAALDKQRYTEALNKGVCVQCKKGPATVGKTTCEPCGLKRARRKADLRHPTSPTPDKGDEQKQDEPMVDAKEVSGWEDHDETMEEGQNGKGEELLDTSFEDADRMVID
ncbi:hypothetical protein PG991_002928 [Apiospora marii]|uniref:Stc1 domain-containing protein n=1 Tax=Apiospora marii TaxID=335849 RepID=A0ABR1SIH5_9PEZI